MEQCDFMVCYEEVVFGCICYVLFEVQQFGEFVLVELGYWLGMFGCVVVLFGGVYVDEVYQCFYVVQVLGVLGYYVVKDNDGVEFNVGGCFVDLGLQFGVMVVGQVQCFIVEQVV